MNYRHEFHAGNFADVHKHIVLIALLKSFLKKESAFCYLDTHAGSGLYHLDSPHAQKSKEYKNGIDKILSAENPPFLVEEYLTCIKNFGKNRYPGSPKIAEYYQRRHDRMVLSELHPNEFNTLKNHFKGAKNTAILLQDGYQSLKAHLPPKEKRGLILIDPSYEKNTEFSDLSHHLTHALKKFAQGVYAIWYPIKERKTIDRFHREIKENISHEIFISELQLYPDDLPTHLNGSGMLIINPPFQLPQLVEESVCWLKEILRIH